MTQKERSKIEKECDILMSKLVRERDKVCLRCGKDKGLQNNHIITRSNKMFKYDFTNCITLCSGCHLYFWHNEKYPTQNVDFLKEKAPRFYVWYLRNVEKLKQANMGLQKFQLNYNTLKDDILKSYGKFSKTL